MTVVEPIRLSESTHHFPKEGEDFEIVINGKYGWKKGSSGYQPYYEEPKTVTFNPGPNTTSEARNGEVTYYLDETWLPTEFAVFSWTQDAGDGSDTNDTIPQDLNP